MPFKFPQVLNTEIDQIKYNYPKIVGIGKGAILNSKITIFQLIYAETILNQCVTLNEKK